MEPFGKLGRCAACKEAESAADHLRARRALEQVAEVAQRPGIHASGQGRHPLSCRVLEDGDEGDRCAQILRQLSHQVAEQVRAAQLRDGERGPPQGLCGIGARREPAPVHA